MCLFKEKKKTLKENRLDFELFFLFYCRENLLLPLGSLEKEIDGVERLLRSSSAEDYTRSGLFYHGMVHKKRPILEYQVQYSEKEPFTLPLEALGANCSVVKDANVVF